MNQPSSSPTVYGWFIFDGAESTCRTAHVTVRESSLLSRDLNNDYKPKCCFNATTTRFQSRGESFPSKNRRPCQQRSVLFATLISFSQHVMNVTSISNALFDNIHRKAVQIVVLYNYCRSKSGFNVTMTPCFGHEYHESSTIVGTTRRKKMILK